MSVKLGPVDSKLFEPLHWRTAQAIARMYGGQIEPPGWGLSVDADEDGRQYAMIRIVAAVHRPKEMNDGLPADFSFWLDVTDAALAYWRSFGLIVHRSERSDEPPGMILYEDENPLFQGLLADDQPTAG